MEMEILAVLMICSFVVLLLIGIPVGFAIATSGFVFGFIGFGSTLFNLLPARIFGVVTNYTMLAIPLFVFMGVMLEKSRIAENMLDTIGHLFGRKPGGMGLAIVLVGVMMGAATGIVGATVVTVGLIALPVLLRRGYNKGLACGTICASGTLGQIIPPSLVLILLADITGESVGTLFAAALIPGLLLAGLFMVYIMLVAKFSPQSAPPIDDAELDAMTKHQLVKQLLQAVLPPLLLVGAVLGSIIGGIAAPTEAASMGALGALLIVALTGRMSKAVLFETMTSTLKTTSMIMFILIAAQTFSLAFRGLNGDQLIEEMFAFLPGGVWGTIIFMMVMLFILGFFLEWIEISYIVLPLLLPIFIKADVNMVWLAILIAMNLQTSFLTPPFGWSLFFLKGVAPPSVTTKDIYLGVLPFIGIQIVALGILMAFPNLALWLPAAIGWMK
jgi:tripartite ATP-independent transporter DctM subunit